MVDQQTNRAGGAGGRLVRVLWLSAGGILLSGFAMRVIAGIIQSSPLRHAGVAVIAVGVALAAIAGLAEWLGNRRARH